MSQEIEAVGLDAVGHALADGSAHGPGTHGSQCANCDTVLQGPWCHACGQHGHDFHRSIWHLLQEFIEGLFHFDGRLWKTLPDLILHPARLTRRFVDGHRAAQIPPLRLFLVMLLLLFFVGPLLNHDGALVKVGGPAARGSADGARRTEAVPRAKDDGDDGDARDEAELAAAAQLARQQAAASAEGAEALRRASGFRDWMEAKAKLVQSHREEFTLILEQWSERFAILMLPVGALLLKVLFVRRRELYLFDHLIFTMHSLSFLCLLILLQLLESATLPDAAPPVILLGPVHLFFHLRGFYRLGLWSAGWRLAVLLTGLSIGAVLLLLGLFSVGVMELSK